MNTQKERKIRAGDTVALRDYGASSFILATDKKTLHWGHSENFPPGPFVVLSTGLNPLALPEAGCVFQADGTPYYRPDTAIRNERGDLCYVMREALTRVKA